MSAELERQGGGGLPSMDVARREIAKARAARDVQTLMKWRSGVMAIQDHAKRQLEIAELLADREDARTVANDAGEVKVRMEAAIGGIDAELHPASPGRPKMDSPSEAIIDVHIGLGVAPATRASWRKLGVLADDDPDLFDGYISNVRADDNGHTVTTARVVSLVKADERDDRHADAITADAVQRAASGGTVEVADEMAVPWLESVPEKSADLLLTDPPYSTDVEDVTAFAAEWLPLALSRVADHGRVYVCVGAYAPELIAYLVTLLRDDRFTTTAPLVWTYRNTLGPRPSHKYVLNYQPIIYAYGPTAPPLDVPLIVEHVSVHDYNHPARSQDRLHEWQKPDALGELFIRHATAPGATVIDPFAGTGTFLYAAARLGRHGRGTEPDANMRALMKANR